MTKSDLIEAVSSRTTITRSCAEAVVNCVFDAELRPRMTEMRKTPSHRVFSAALLAAVLCCPSLARATQGREDTYMILSVVLFALPATPTLLGLLIASIVRLASKRPPRPGQGKVAFVLSLGCLGLSVLLPVLTMAASGWFDLMVTTMLTIFVPIFLLALASAILARRVMGRAAGDNQLPGASL